MTMFKQSSAHQRQVMSLMGFHDSQKRGRDREGEIKRKGRDKEERKREREERKREREREKKLRNFFALIQF